MANALVEAGNIDVALTQAASWNVKVYDMAKGMIVSLDLARLGKLGGHA